MSDAAARIMANMPWPKDWPEHGKVNYYPMIDAILVQERREVVRQAREILHEEGWLGRSEQRIAALADPLPNEGPLEEVPT